MVTYLSYDFIKILDIPFFLNVGIFHFLLFVYIFLLQFFFAKIPIIRYIYKHSIFKAKLAKTRLKVTWLFVLHYSTIFTQTEMKTLVILSLFLSFSLCLSLSLCLLIIVPFYYIICNFHFIQIVLRSNNR